MYRTPRLIWKFFLVVSLCCTLLGCSKITQENFDKVRPGMPMKEVVAILGEPTTTESLNVAGISGTSAIWRNKNTEIVIQFFNDQVTIKSLKKLDEKRLDAT